MNRNKQYKKYSIYGILVVLLFTSAVVITNYVIDKQTLVPMTKLKVGLIDGSVKASLSQFYDTKVISKNFVSNATQVDEEHGTAVAYTIMKHSPLAKVDTLYSASVTENGFVSQDKLLQALNWFEERHVNLINISLNMPRPTKEIKNKLTQLTKNGAVIVLSMGNNNYFKNEPLKIKGVVQVGTQKEYAVVEKIKPIQSIDLSGAKKKYEGISFNTARQTGRYVSEWYSYKNIRLP